MTSLTTPRGRGIRVLVAAIAAVTAVAVVSGLTLAPRAIAAPLRSIFMDAVDAFSPVQVPWLAFGGADVVLNAMLFVPLGATIALLFARWAWPFAIVAGFLLSSAVEFAQTTIPGRVPDLDDVFWNTAGGAVGVIAVTVPRLIAAAIRRVRQRGRATRT